MSLSTSISCDKSCSINKDAHINYAYIKINTRIHSLYLNLVYYVTMNTVDKVLKWYFAPLPLMYQRQVPRLSRPCHDANERL